MQNIMILKCHCIYALMENNDDTKLCLSSMVHQFIFFSLNIYVYV